MLWWQGPVLLNPQFAIGTKDQEGSRIFYEPLAAWDNDGNLVPILAADIPVARMLELARSFASPKKLLDRTLPITSLMAGRKVTNLFREVFGDLALEDLWTPCFAISSGLSRATAVVHARGRRKRQRVAPRGERHVEGDRLPLSHTHANDAGRGDARAGGRRQRDRRLDRR